MSKRTKRSETKQSDLQARIVKHAATYTVEAFEPVAKLITPSPPSWLTEHLHSWAPSVMLAAAVEVHQPSRAEMRDILANVKDSAALLLRAIGEPAVCEFLNTSSKGPLPRIGLLQALLADIHGRAEEAFTSKNLANADGKTKVGRGVAVPKGAISPQTYCALLIAEAFNYLNGKYPAETDPKAAEAADRLWRLSMGERRPWGNNPLTAWRRHFKKALSDEVAKLPEAATRREEYRRHLRAVAEQARQLEVDDLSRT